MRLCGWSGILSPMSAEAPEKSDIKQDEKPEQPEPPKEIGGREGLDPTRYGDWEKAGRCIDF